MGYPHYEGTWPNTREWIQVSMAGVPEIEARAILGENAIQFYGLDRDKLEKVADRIGPLASEVLVNHHSVDQRLVDHFHKRAGYARPADPIDAEVIERSFRSDARMASV